MIILFVSVVVEKLNFHLEMLCIKERNSSIGIAHARGIISIHISKFVYLSSQNNKKKFHVFNFYVYLVPDLRSVAIKEFFFSFQVYILVLLCFILIILHFKDDVAIDGLFRGRSGSCSRPGAKACREKLRRERLNERRVSSFDQILQEIVVTFYIFLYYVFSNKGIVSG